MRTSILPLLIVLTSLPLHAEPGKPATDKEKMSYSLGHQLGSNYKHQSMDVDPDMLRQGIQDALAGTPPALSEADMDKLRADLRRQAQAAQRQQAEAAAEAKRAPGRAFLAENGKKAGVTTLPSGLQYRVIQAGTGKQPGPRDSVTVHYRGTRIDGSEFDSSYRRQEPASFPLNGVIAGWTEGLQLMREGARHELFIPPELAYGDKGRLANETLVFEVELLSVTPAATPGTTAPTTP